MKTYFMAKNAAWYLIHQPMNQYGTNTTCDEIGIMMT